jgi:anthranilate synthase component 1
LELWRISEADPPYKLSAHQAPDPLGCPDILLLVSEEVVVFDNLSGEIYLVVHADPGTPNAHAHGLARLDDLALRLRAPIPANERPTPPGSS